MSSKYGGIYSGKQETAAAQQERAFRQAAQRNGTGNGVEPGKQVGAGVGAANGKKKEAGSQAQKDKGYYATAQKGAGNRKK
jgi:hypothetical protein